MFWIIGFHVSLISKRIVISGTPRNYFLINMNVSLETLHQPMLQKSMKVLWTKYKEKMERNIASKMSCEFPTFWDISMWNLFPEEIVQCKISSPSLSKRSLVQKNYIHYKSWLPVTRLAEMTFLGCVWKTRENWWSTMWFLGSGRRSSLCLLPTSPSQPKTELEHEKWFVFMGAGKLFPSPIFLLHHTQVLLSSRNLLEPFTVSLGLSNHWHWC